MAIKVTRKDQGEADANIIRRFNRKVLQSGVLPLAKSQMRFRKPISKRERRNKAILREQNRARKQERMRLGYRRSNKPCRCRSRNCCGYVRIP